MRKTEYMCVNERQVKGTVKMQGEEVAKVVDFKYIWAQLFKVLVSAEEKRRREYRQNGMGGEECQE